MQEKRKAAWSNIVGECKAPTVLTQDTKMEFVICPLFGNVKQYYIILPMGNVINYMHIFLYIYIYIYITEVKSDEFWKRQERFNGE